MIRGNSKSFHLGVQSTFNPKDMLNYRRAARTDKLDHLPITTHQCPLYVGLYTILLSKPGGGNVTDRESNPRSVGASSGDSTTHLKKVSCDEWYWNPSPDISGYMCGARRVVRSLLLTTIAITNIVWCIAYKRRVGGGSYRVQ